MPRDMILQNETAKTDDGQALYVAGLGCVGFQVSGTFVGTVSFECTVDGANWVSLQTKAMATKAAAIEATAPGVFQANIGGLTQVRARVSAFTSGKITVNAFASEHGSVGVLGE